jgi:cell division protein FtsQ
MKLNKQYINYAARGVIVLALLASVIGFTERNPEGEVCHEVIIAVENCAENYFLGEDDIMQLLTNNGMKPVAGAPYSTLNLKDMEESIHEEAFVDEAELYRDLKGNLHVKVVLKRPMARIVRSDGPHAYIAEDRSLMPVSTNYSSRVLLLSGDIGEEMDDTSIESILELVERIYLDPFWSKQIAQIHVKKNGEVDMYPQVTKQVIEFGLPDNADEKFKKLRIFYKKILPSKGWNAYSRVNVAFKDQIIAE